MQKGTQGVYLYGSQRLWFRHPGKDHSGITGFFQYGINNSKTLPIYAYAGAGFTAFGLVGNRIGDSFGLGLAYSKLNRRLNLRSSELIVQGYYQAKLFSNIYAEPVLTWIPNPGASKNLKPVWAATARLIALF
jgi:porin